MTKDGSIFAFSTSNYEAMKGFFEDFGFEVVEEPGNQLVPVFNSGRGATVRRHDLVFNLEEGTTGNQSGAFNLLLTDYTAEEIQAIKALGHIGDCQASLYGEFHSFRTPDGGTLMLG